MNFLDKFQEVIYDLIGYLFPGLLTIFILIPSLILYKDTGAIILPVEVLCDKNNIDKFKILINTDFSTNKGIFILISAYLLGHLIKFLAMIFYKIVTFIETHMCDTKKIKISDDIINKSVQIYMKNFKNVDIESYEREKKVTILAGYGRTQIRMYSVPSLVQKYISKYNFYCSLAFLNFIVFLNVFITFLKKNTILLGVSILLVIFICLWLAKRLKKWKNNSINVIWKKVLNVMESLFTFSGVICFFIIPTTIALLQDKTMTMYWLIYIISILLYITFDNEYRRHYVLHVKEALFGIIYIDDNEEKKYSIKYNKGKLI